MEAGLYLLAPPPHISLAKPSKALLLTSSSSSINKSSSSSSILMTRLKTLQCQCALPNDSSTVDYDSSVTSVFPAEACETIGGEACDAEMYPEVKLKPEANTNETNTKASETVERDYLEYNTPKTVFPGEACDDLGGEFCDPEYQKGVF